MGLEDEAFKMSQIPIPTRTPKEIFFSLKNHEYIKEDKLMVGYPGWFFH